MLKTLFFVFLITISFAIARCQTGRVLAPDEDQYFEALPFQMPSISLPGFSDRTLDIMVFGAVADGHTDNAEAINRAIPVYVTHYRQGTC